MASKPTSAQGTLVQRQAFSFYSLLPLLLLFYATLLPPEVRIEILGQNLYAPRLVTMLLLPWMLRRLVKDGLRIQLPDLLVFAGSAWMIISFVAFYGFEEGFTRGVAIAFDVVAGFIIARLSIRNTTDFLRFLVLIVPGVLMVGLIMMAESVSHRFFIRPLAADIFGPLARFRDGVEVGLNAQFNKEVRLGLMRSGGPFAHSILGGLFMASMLPLFLYSGLRKWPLWLGSAAGLCVIFTGSSAAILAVVLSIGLLIFDWLQKRVAVLKWSYLVIFGGSALAFVQAFSQNGVFSIIVRNTLNPQTGYFRLLIWEYGIESIKKYPLIGIGYTEYERALWMPPSVDNHWLMLGIRHGLFTPICLGLACALVIFRLAIVSRKQSELGRRFFVGCAISLFVFAIMGFTVSFFSSIQYWFFILIGAGVSMCMAQVIDPAFRRQYGTPANLAPAS